jgi:DNA polymerase-3 subunit epsilon
MRRLGARNENSPRKRDVVEDLAPPYDEEEEERAMSGLPTTIVAVDVETTGLHSKDRIVTFGGLRLNLNSIVGGQVKLDWLYFIADPGKKSHPRAEEVHGYNDWVLRHQEPFSENADIAAEFVSSGDILIAHNASFDCEFIDREFILIGRPPPRYRSYCTMNKYRQSGLPGRSSLNAICQEIGLARLGERHGALEDAWLAMMVYFRLNGLGKYINSYEEIARQGLPSSPTNFIESPPMPSGPLPRCSRKLKESVIEGDERVRQINKGRKAELMMAVQPPATLLLEVARADYQLKREEVDILVALVREIRDQKNIEVDSKVEIEVVADLLDLKFSERSLVESAETVYKDPALRETFPRWLAGMAAADGVLSMSEREGIDRVKAAIFKALSTQ